MEPFNALLRDIVREPVLDWIRIVADKGALGEDAGDISILGAAVTEMGGTTTGAATAMVGGATAITGTGTVGVVATVVVAAGAGAVEGDEISAESCDLGDFGASPPLGDSPPPDDDVFLDTIKLLRRSKVERALVAGGERGET